MHETRQELGDERLERRRDRDDERGGGGRLGGVRFLLSLLILVLVALLLLAVVVLPFLVGDGIVVSLGALLPALLRGALSVVFGFILLLDLLLLDFGFVHVHLVDVGVFPFRLGLEPLLGILLSLLLLLLLALDRRLGRRHRLLGLLSLLLGDARDG